jgi:hypothetical protein
MPVRRTTATLLLAGVTCLTGCQSSAGDLQGLGLQQAHQVTQAQARDFISQARQSLSTGGYSIRFQLDDPNSSVTITRQADRIQFPLDGFRMGTAGQLTLGDATNPWLATAYDDGRRTLCRSGRCVSFTDQTTSKVPATLAQLANAVNVLSAELPVTPTVIQEASSSLDGLPTTATLWTGVRTTPVGDAQCVAATSPVDGPATLLCVLQAGQHPGVVVDTGAHDEGDLNHAVVDVLSD